MHAFRLCQRDLAVKPKSDLDGAVFGQHFGGTVYLWSWESFILQVKQYLPQQKLGHGEYTGERVVVKEITIKGKVIPSILSEYYLFHYHL